MSDCDRELQFDPFVEVSSEQKAGQVAGSVHAEEPSDSASSCEVA